MSPYVEFLVAIMLPTAAVYLLIAMGRGFLWASGRRWRGPAPEPEPLDRLAANLRRLRTQLEHLETRSDVTAKNVRLRALRGAYADALGTACQRLQVVPPASAGAERARQAEIYRVESELRQRGLDVREPASR